MSVLSSLQPYTDSNGLVQPYINPPIDSSNNGILYTSEMIIALLDNNVLNIDEINTLNVVYKSCEVIPGLMEHNPDKSGGQDSPDDYWGCGVASAFLNNNLAANILSYGNNKSKSHSQLSGSFWSKLGYHILRFYYWNGIPQVYNNEDPGKFTWSAWLGRFPHLTAHLKWAADLSPNLVERLWWAASLIISSLASSSNAGAWALCWLQVRLWELKGNGPLEWLAVKIWRWRFSKVFGNPGNMLGQYFQNPNHPLALALQNSK